MMRDNRRFVSTLVHGRRLVLALALALAVLGLAQEAGGWQSANVHQKISAEGVAIVDAAGTDYAPWVDGTQRVRVSDGKLTVKNGAGAANNSICLIHITRL